MVKHHLQLVKLTDCLALGPRSLDSHADRCHRAWRALFARLDIYPPALGNFARATGSTACDLSSTTLTTYQS